MLHAPVPRHLRVRPTVQIAGQRLPAKGFILAAGVVLLGGIALVFGADLERTVWLVATLVLIGLMVVEGRLWGRSSREIVRIIVRYHRRPRRLRRAPVVLTLAPQPVSAAPAPRRPRWMEGQP